jgi:hypothetical protein
MRPHKDIALRVAGLLFGTWLLIALAAADLPPPPGFLFLALILLACALLVYLRVCGQTNLRNAHPLHGNGLPARVRTNLDRCPYALWSKHE